MTRWIPWLPALAALVACDAPLDSGVDDTDTAIHDTDVPDDTDTDTDTDAIAVPLDGYGAISGDCGVLDDSEWSNNSPFLFVSAIDFDVAFDAALLTEEGQEVIADGNLGGSSVESEAIAMDLLARCELAALVATEGEVVYDVEGKKTDLVVEIDGHTVGVSVTRAVGWPRDAEYTVGQAEDLLNDKLADIPLAAANVGDEHAWTRSILYVLSYSPAHTTSLQAAWSGGNVTTGTKGDTLVIVTTTNGSDGFVYGDDSP